MRGQGACVKAVDCVSIPQEVQAVMCPVGVAILVLRPFLLMGPTTTIKPPWPLSLKAVASESGMYAWAPDMCVLMLNEIWQNEDEAEVLHFSLMKHTCRTCCSCCSDGCGREAWTTDWFTRMATLRRDALLYDALQGFIRLAY